MDEGRGEAIDRGALVVPHCGVHLHVGTQVSGKGGRKGGGRIREVRSVTTFLILPPPVCVCVCVYVCETQTSQSISYLCMSLEITDSSESCCFLVWDQTL